MISALVSRLIILAFGFLYPAYSSYKAVRTRDVKEYVKWMMYWIVFALFTFVETFTDVLFSFWFPFYYELKVGIVIWLLSPATKGSSFLYRNFVHPALQKRENEIDDYLVQAKEKGYTAVVSIGSKGVSYATNVIVQTALKGGGGIVDHLKKSYSLTDLGPPEPKKAGRGIDTTDIPEEESPPRPHRRSTNPSPNVNMYFSEVDVNMKGYQPNKDALPEVRSTEDISSGYGSTDQLYSEGVLTRASSVSLSRGRGRSAGRTTRRTPLTDELELGEDCSEEQVLSGENSFSHESTIQNQGKSIIKSTELHSNGFISPSLKEGTAAPVDGLPAVINKSNIEVHSSSNVNIKSRTSSGSSFISIVSDLSDDSLSMKSFNSSEGDDIRAGKYRKLRAPPPPSPPSPLLAIIGKESRV